MATTLCIRCHLPITPPERVAIGYCTCLTCGEHEARNRKFTVVPLNKGNYMVMPKELLPFLNPKRGGL